MIRTGTWAYLEATLDLKRSIELKSTINGGYSACIKGLHFGVGESAKGAFLDAVKESKRRRKFDAR